MFCEPYRKQRCHGGGPRPRLPPGHAVTGPGRTSNIFKLDRRTRSLNFTLSAPSQVDTGDTVSIVPRDPYPQLCLAKVMPEVLKQVRRDMNAINDSKRTPDSQQPCFKRSFVNLGMSAELSKRAVSVSRLSCRSLASRLIAVQPCAAWARYLTRRFWRLKRRSRFTWIFRETLCHGMVRKSVALHELK